MRDDTGKLIGMSAWLALEDVEQACETMRGLGFEALALLFTQVGSRLIPARVFDGHYAAAGQVVRDAGLEVSTLNCIEGAPLFDPFSSEESRRASAERLAEHLRHAAAMGAPGILIWDGELGVGDDPAGAAAQLTDCIGRARDVAGASAAELSVSVELHPFTFGLAQHRLEDLAQRLPEVGAGFCVDFCHFGVAHGGDFLEWLTPTVTDAVNEIHYADTDCVTSEFHYPPGRGQLDLDALYRHFAGRGLPAALDLFQWPAPRSGAREGMKPYSDFVRSQKPGS